MRERGSTFLKAAPYKFKAVTLLLVMTLILFADFGIRQIYLFFTKENLKFHHPHRISHPVYHHGIQANMQSTDAIGRYEAPFFSNSLGMKDAEVREVPLAGARPRVLLMGDSFTEGIGTAWDKTFAGILAERLDQEGVELLNGGTVSYCPHLIRLRLDQLLDRGLKIDRVVLFFDISDVLNELQYADAGNGAVRYEEFAPFQEQGEAIRKINQTNAWLESTVERNFVLLGALSRNLRLLWRSQESKVGIRDYDEIPRWAYEWPDYRGPYEKFVEEGLQRARMNLDQIANRLKRENVAFTMVVYPWPQQIRRGTRAGRGETFWRNWCAEKGVDFVSLYPAFLDQGASEQVIRKYFWKDDCHWNEEGQRLVAKALYEENRDRILPPSRRAGVSP